MGSAVGNEERAITESNREWGLGRDICFEWDDRSLQRLISTQQTRNRGASRGAKHSRAGPAERRKKGVVAAASPLRVAPQPFTQKPRSPQLGGLPGFG